MFKLLPVLLSLLSTPAYAGDPAFWGKYPPEIHAWFPTVMQPGRERYTNTQSSCCGTGDAFEARADGEDQWGNIRIIIDDGKGLIEDGTVVSAPREKIQVNYGNPLGILIVFLQMSDRKTVLCLVPATQG